MVAVYVIVNSESKLKIHRSKQSLLGTHSQRGGSAQLAAAGITMSGEKDGSACCALWTVGSDRDARSSSAMPRCCTAVVDGAAGGRTARLCRTSADAHGLGSSTGGRWVVEENACCNAGIAACSLGSPENVRLELPTTPAEAPVGSIGGRQRPRDRAGSLGESFASGSP